MLIYLLVEQVISSLSSTSSSAITNSSSSMSIASATTNPSISNGISNGNNSIGNNLNTTTNACDTTMMTCDARTLCSEAQLPIVTLNCVEPVSELLISYSNNKPRSRIPINNSLDLDLDERTTHINIQSPPRSLEPPLSQTKQQHDHQPTELTENNNHLINNDHILTDHNSFNGKIECLDEFDFLNNYNFTIDANLYKVNSKAKTLLIDAPNSHNSLNYIN